MVVHRWIEDTSMRLVVPYSSAYPAIFEAIRTEILRAVDGVHVEHFGSTAVPGLAAKPMIDVLVVVPERDLLSVKREMTGLGFHERDVWVDTTEKPYVGGSVRWNGTPYDVNVHICREGSPDHTRNILFRDALRTDPELRARYSEIKNHAITAVGTDPREYNRFKESFIKSAISAAGGD